MEIFHEKNKVMIEKQLFIININNLLIRNVGKATLNWSLALRHPARSIRFHRAKVIFLQIRWVKGIYMTFSSCLSLSTIVSLSFFRSSLTLELIMPKITLKIKSLGFRSKSFQGFLPEEVTDGRTKEAHIQSTLIFKLIIPKITCLLHRNYLRNLSAGCNRKM